MAEYLDDKSSDHLVLMCHDIDRMPGKALKTASVEHKLGIRTTYYFRTIKSVFKPELISQIKDMEHEIGYHYETLNEAKGYHEKSIDLFQSNLEYFRKVCEIRTIYMHGKPPSKYNNFDLWNSRYFRDFGITGEACSARNGLNYFSDTGRIWGSGINLRDYIPSKKEQFIADTTDDFINLIERNEFSNFYILTQPERCSSSITKWCLYYSADIAANFVKKVLMRQIGDNQYVQRSETHRLSITFDIKDLFHVPSVCGSWKTSCIRSVCSLWGRLCYGLSCWKCVN